MVGGTGLYIKAALYDYNFNDEDEVYNYDKYSNEELYQELLSVDPNTEIHPNNRKRVERAITYYRNHNIPMSENIKSEKLLYDAMFIGLTTDREVLYERINRRVDKMVEEGLIDEAKSLYDLKIDSRALLTPICYKELFMYFEGNSTLEEALDLIRQRSRKYAKRQYTWFNNQMDIKWFDVDFDCFDNTVLEIENYINSLKD